jgi:hypothetical protein
VICGVNGGVAAPRESYHGYFNRLSREFCSSPKRASAATVILYTLVGDNSAMGGKLDLSFTSPDFLMLPTGFNTVTITDATTCVVLGVACTGDPTLASNQPASDDITALLSTSAASAEITPTMERERPRRRPRVRRHETAAGDRRDGSSTTDRTAPSLSLNWRLSSRRDGRTLTASDIRNLVDRVLPLVSTTLLIRGRDVSFKRLTARLVFHQRRF